MTRSVKVEVEGVGVGEMGAGKYEQDNSKMKDQELT